MRSYVTYIRNMASDRIIMDNFNGYGAIYFLSLNAELVRGVEAVYYV